MTDTTTTWQPMTPAEMAEAFGPYHGQTAYLPRPTGEYDDRERAQWDRSEAERQRIQAMGREHDARREREAQATHAAMVQAEDERRGAERSNVEAIARGRYMQASGATEAAWERNRERIVDEEIEQMGVAADQRSRGRFAAMLGH